MTLANRREPSFDGAHKPSPTETPEGLHVGTADQKAHAAGRASGLTRVVSSAQIIGSLLAVPLGLVSGYSMYRANFAVDTTCQNLRAGIIAMLDKNVDAATRRMLVRRDIATFERTCGGFDPDAHAAFKTLLESPPPPAATAAAPKLRSALPAADVARKAEPKTEPKEVKAEAKAAPKPEAKVEAKAESKPEPKSEPRPAVAEKAPVVVPAAAGIESIEREAALSDTRWLAAVREALVTNSPEAAVRGSEPANLEVPAPKAARTEMLAVAKPAAAPVHLQQTWNTPGQVAAPVTAPLVTAPVPAVDVPDQIVPVRDDRPRPPAPITGPSPINGATDSDDNTKSRIGSWIAQIPLVGRVIEPRRD